MLVGSDDASKSTLINYLNDIPLIPKKQALKWILTLKYPNDLHISSEKYIFYSPNDTDFTYMKYSLTHEIELTLVDNFYLKQLANKVRRVKILLLVTHHDLFERNGQQFRDGMRVVLNILKSFDINIQSAFKSIGIVLTQVENKNNEDDEVTEIVCDKLNEILNDERNNLSRNEGKFFTRIILDNQVGIFSTPRLSMHTLSKNQSSNIKYIINDLMEYSECNEFKFNLDYENNIGIKFPLQLYVNQRYESFFRDFEVEVIDLFLTKISTLSQMDEAVHIFHLISTLKDNRILTFLNDSIIFRDLILKFELINYLDMLISGQQNVFFQNISETYSEFLSNLNKKVSEFLLDRFKKIANSSQIRAIDFLMVKLNIKSEFFFY